MTVSVLDPDELLHLATRSMRAGDHEKAIEQLKRALVVAPDDARLHFMLGAEHAEIGMNERAVEGMQRALALDVDMHPARLQLGLLQLMSGQSTDARVTWKGLEALSPDHPMVLFKNALLLFHDGSIPDGITLLKKAIDNENRNIALKTEMQRMLKRLQEQAPQADAIRASAVSTLGASELLSRYEEASSGPPNTRKH